MPVLHRRPQVIAPGPLADARSSIESSRTLSEPLWIVDEDYERPQKEIDFPTAALRKVASRKESVHNLRINTYAESELPDRYMSSEEEPSPSPDSETYEEEELKHKTSSIMNIEDAVECGAEPASVEDYKTEMAVAVPIFVGRPKLVDITNIAPMHKRKRSAELHPKLLRSAVKRAASSIRSVTDENTTFIAQAAIKVVTPKEPLPKRTDSLPILAPESWFPDDATIVAREEEEEEEEGDHYFPDLELRSPLTYNDYDPYSLDPPRLSPRSSYSSHSSHSKKGAKKPGSVARARNNSTPPVAMGNGWKGLTRSLSLAKKQTIHHRDLQVTKKPKMIARAADERRETPVIPAFAFGEDVG
ncbi:hypothetical protein N7G274_009441 [Stereocaulon virgatum]|uniref:Uncharacterized protein n=1 Tax=Stereocaulon virgatum TaxID=373712 RepID=A0ABR3ZYF3_9LECA